MKWNRGLLLVIVVLIAVGVLIFYFTYFGNESRKQSTLQDTKKGKLEERETTPIDPKNTTAQSPTASISQEEIEEGMGEKEVENKSMRLEKQCQKMERDLQEFFSYLDERDYVKKLELGEDTYSRFTKIIRSLSLNPPLPAGEGFDYDMIIKNIYHFYRALDSKDLKLIKVILENEADTMEINLALFYQWLMSSEECGQKEIQPTLDTLYRYAGFLVNSIGGRAYLFRRKTKLRLLLYYYNLLIIHEADKKKMNSFGVDITPFLEPLAEEIENYELLYFRKEYAGKLITIRNYYRDKRKIS